MLGPPLLPPSLTAPPGPPQPGPTPIPPNSTMPDQLALSVLGYLGLLVFRVPPPGRGWETGVKIDGLSIINLLATTSLRKPKFKILTPPPWPPTLNPPT